MTQEELNVFNESLDLLKSQVEKLSAYVDSEKWNGLNSIRSGVSSLLETVRMVRNYTPEVYSETKKVKPIKRLTVSESPFVTMADLREMTDATFGTRFTDSLYDNVPTYGDSE